MCNSPKVDISLKGKTFYDEKNHCVYLVIDEYTHKVPTTGEEEPMVVYSKIANLQVFDPRPVELYCKFNLNKEKYVSFKSDFYYHYREIFKKEEI